MGRREWRSLYLPATSARQYGQGPDIDCAVCEEGAVVWFRVALPYNALNTAFLELP
jgi:hypothetical protein